MSPPATELTEAIGSLFPDGGERRALDLACGGGRHAIWLRDRGWRVTAVDIALGNIDGVTCIRADLSANGAPPDLAAPLGPLSPSDLSPRIAACAPEPDGFQIEPGAWDLIVCWLYWQDNLLPSIIQGVRPGGAVALSGKTIGRFATSLDHYRQAFQGWEEISAGEDGHRAFFIARLLPPASFGPAR